jgi:hypothetical protein
MGNRLVLRIARKHIIVNEQNLHWESGISKINELVWEIAVARPALNFRIAVTQTGGERMDRSAKTSSRA